MTAPVGKTARLALGLGLLWMFVVLNSAFAPSPAQAGSYTYKACDKTMGHLNWDSAFWAINNVGFMVRNECPYQLVISNQFHESSEPMIFGDTGGFEFPVTPAPLEEVRMDVSGGDLSGSVEYSFSHCIGCEPIAIIEPTDDAGWVERTVQLNGATNVRIQARCMALTCPRVPDLRMKNFEVPIDDETAPEIDTLPLAEWVLWSPGWSIRNAWIGGETATLYSNVRDRVSGVGRIRVAIDGVEIVSKTCSNYMATETPIPRACGEYMSWSSVMDLSSFPNGLHTLQVDAEDAVGNVAETFTENFYTDGTPPAQPEKPRVLNPKGFNGWSHDAEFEIGFDNPLLDPVNNDGSQLRYIRWDLQPRDGQELDPPAQYDWRLFQPLKVRLPAEGRWRVWFWYEDHSGNISNRAHIDLGLDYDEPIAPTLDRNDWISASRLMAGYSQTWTHNDQPSDLESGVCGFAFDVDDVVGAVPDIEIDAPADATAAEVSPRVGAGRHFSHLRAVGCNGLGSDVDTVLLNVDGKPPEAAAFPAETEEWKATQTNLTLSGADDLSGVERILYRFPGQLAEVVEATRADVPMPEGEQTVEFWALDRAGNESERRTTTVRTDTTPPIVSFAPRSNLKPATLVAEVQDGGSGVATTWLEMSEAGLGAWRQLGPTVSPNAKAHSFSREIPGDVSLLGVHEFRVVAIDRAGNRTVGVDGSGAMTVTLPVKAATALSFGLAKVVERCRTDAGKSCRSASKCPRGTSCRPVNVIDRRSATAFKRTRFGDPLALVGTLSAGNGTPLSARSVEIVALPKFGVERVIKTVLTDERGGFELPLDDAPSTFYTARFAGDDMQAAQQQTVESSVRAKVIFRASRKRARANQTIRFSGRVYGAPEYAMDGRKEVTLQFLRGRRWMNTGNSVQTGAGGRFSTTFSSQVVAKRSPVYFHAKVSSVAPWPFEVASSKPVLVVFIP